MKAKVIYGLVIGLLIVLSGGLYLYDRQEEGLVIEGATDVGEISGEGYSRTQPEETTIILYLTGAVVNPDIYEIPEDTRLYELIELAGGFSPEAAKDYLNLARVVFDGEMIHVPSVSEKSEDQESGISHTRVSINQGDLDSLMTLTGIGETKAAAIIAYRKANGPFQRIEDIMNVDGIKDAMFNKIKDDITI